MEKKYALEDQPVNRQLDLELYMRRDCYESGEMPMGRWLPLVHTVHEMDSARCVIINEYPDHGSPSYDQSDGLAMHMPTTGV